MSTWKLLHLHGEGEGAPAPAPASAPALASAAASAPTEGAAPEGASTEQPDKAALFAQMTGEGGEYAEQFSQAVAQAAEKAVQRRLKPMGRMKDQLTAQQKLIDAVSLRYGVDGADLDALQKAISDDTSYIERIADEKGMTMEQAAGWLKDQQKLQEFNRKLAEMETRQRIETNRQLLAQGIEETKQTYPDFDFDTEAQNPQFMQLLGPLSVIGAYEAIHRDEIRGNLIRMAAQETEKRVTDTIRANGMRPAENGINGTAGVVPTKLDLNKMSKKELDDIIKRGQRGEKLSFI